MSNSRRSLWLFFLALLFIAAPVSGRSFEEISLVASPTAGILPHGAYLFRGSLGPDSGLLFGVRVGFRDRLMVGVSYGVQEFIGRGEVQANDIPGFQLRLRVIEEGIQGPAIAVGIDTQGEDGYIEDWERYERKSKGFYVAFSKNYRLIRDFSIHGGVNWSLEDRDENGFDLFAGLALEVAPGFVILGDYAAGLNDDDRDIETTLTRGRGYLDAGVRFDYRENLRLKVLFRDLTGNYLPKKGVARAVEIFWIDYF